MSSKTTPYINIAFPLNVYAHSLSLEEDQVDYLHYGLFKPDESIHQVQIAQQRSSDLVLKYLPKPPCRILEIGIGLGTTASILAERGYSITGISPDPYQVAIAKERVPDTVNLECISFEAFSAPKESFDVILLQESAQYINSLLLYNKSYDLLSSNGVVLLLDEFSLKRSAEYIVDNLHILTYNVAQAQRCGFNLSEQIDLCKPAAPTVDYLLWVIKKHRASLVAYLALQDGVLDNLLIALGEYKQKYHNGSYGYFLLKFSKKPDLRWKITTVTAPDKDAVKILFNEVFQPEQMSDALWEWKYGQERGLGIAAWRDGKMIAHYGAIRREINYFGQAKLAIQIADVMVSVKERGSLTRQGAFFLTAATFPESYVGYGARFWLGYGFPSQRAMKIAEHLNLYAPVGKMIELRWQSNTTKPHLWTRIRHLQPQHKKKNKKIINKLWMNMANSLKKALVGVRDWNYVQHRYFLHPHKQYEILLITRRFTNQALAVVVIHRQDETCRIMDFIGNPKYLPETIKQIRRMAGVWGMKTVIVWITANFSKVFPQQDAEEHDLEIIIPHTIWSKTVPPTEIEGHWWLMSGDTDFL
jgi:SAM-dependent methyltransferase